MYLHIAYIINVESPPWSQNGGCWFTKTDFHRLVFFWRLDMLYVRICISIQYHGKPQPSCLGVIIHTLGVENPSCFMVLGSKGIYWIDSLSLSLSLSPSPSQIIYMYISYTLSIFSCLKEMSWYALVQYHIKLKFIPDDIVFMISFWGLTTGTGERMNWRWIKAAANILDEWDATKYEPCCYGSTWSPTNTLLKFTWILQLAMFQKQYLFQTLRFNIWAASGFKPQTTGA